MVLVATAINRKMENVERNNYIPCKFSLKMYYAYQQYNVF